MKRFSFILSILTLLVSGCSQDENWEQLKSSETDWQFSTSFEQVNSRTYIEEGNLLRWTEGDQISLFKGNTLNCQYLFDGKTGDNSGTFSRVDQSFGTGNDLTAHYAVYPYASDIKITEKGVITATLNAEQNYAENSFGLGANTMVAVTENLDDTFLAFKNVGGYLKLQLYGEDVTVKTITLTGNNNEKLAGKATITSVYGEAPTISMTEDATESITLNCGEGVKIGTTAETATAFWMVVPPTTFEKGFTITIMDINGFEFTKSTSNEISIIRNVIKPMSTIEVEPVDENKIPYITFTADATQTFSMSQAVETLEYSVNGGEWTELGTSVIDFGGEYGKLQLRGKSLTGTASSYIDYSNISFGNDISVTCSGDIRTLVDYENYNTADTQKARFIKLFENCSSLVSAPELPATTLADYCYAYMFYCTGLTTAPELPATTLADDCYYSMFSSCINLTTAPELPATTLADDCYYSMFSYCSNLTTAPELPATTLADLCYTYMFYCTGLTTAPELPATTLAGGCYANMFSSCTNLTTAPELPATTLAGSCYYSMFSFCTNLTTAPELPATTLADDCYSGMFIACTGLTTAPELPATTLADRCYAKMFYDCNKVNSIVMLATDISATQCLLNWMAGVSPTGTLTKAPEMESLPIGASGIPSGWTVKNYGEE